MAVAILTAAVAPKVRPSQIDGQAVASALAGSPAVGDCLLAIRDRLPNLSAATDSNVVVGYPTATLGTCDGPIVGEVGYMLAGANPPAKLTVDNYRSDLEACAEGTVGYTGSIPSVVDDPSTTTAMAWELSLRMQRIPFGPTAVQRRAGQHWSACAVTAAAGQPYRGRLNGALTTGTVPSSLGSCWSSGALATAEEVSCAVPHQVELLGVAPVNGPSDSMSDIRRSCRVFAARVLQTPDPTERGTVSITVVMTSSTSLSSVGQPTVLCLAMDRLGGSFNGTLIGLRSRAVPRP